jgi:hypothetical protein
VVAVTVNLFPQPCTEFVPFFTPPPEPGEGLTPPGEFWVPYGIAGAPGREQFGTLAGLAASEPVVIERDGL